ncbi:MAG TPA: elongation factor P, partial [Prolixibacteraceae bacterium]|nr:elongation factor P [Prolixibacteraceae bacterium]
MATTADFKNGLCIEWNDQLWTVVQFLHVKPGKGAAFVRTKLKNLKTGRTVENTFNAGVKIDVVRIERRPYQYLYKDDMGCNFMH